MNRSRVAVAITADDCATAGTLHALSFVGRPRWNDINTEFSQARANRILQVRARPSSIQK